ncbi:hypothetical protein COY90_02795 [Candidatus Roizmanbacteria bacterium CG_4_10_14_0_8_um_filter_39_9]|uniref:Uncharacterized protein n=1 Tax=Candidatus Roizmanbacteria bacterium CG_4_10_14_0_8_um_filter_39_9 TaxID=1974829 RepID=A0A2M7QDN5_9BACT|nr:MAG: hypothetical protein COY90_02795 [Candidatus Roizmanbacteria bacterium CG_4_10_14_0_8_um_filter_39_9]
MNLVEQLIDLAKEIETEDPIDFAMLQIDEDVAYTLMATAVLEMYLSNDKDSRDMILLATVIKLTVENFVLNLKLLQNDKPV